MARVTPDLRIVLTVSWLWVTSDLRIVVMVSWLAGPEPPSSAGTRMAYVLLRALAPPADLGLWPWRIAAFWKWLDDSGFWRRLPGLGPSDKFGSN
jgi:hypothetical protein